ncbi:MAG: hypothetical protein ACK5FV_07420 [Bacteroidota bacterium]|jgi:hypothetical protein|nr:hypothetical protein [Saprospiraceae bacterium]
MDLQNHNQQNDPVALNSSVEVPASPSDSMSPEQHRRLFRRGVLWLGAGVALMGLSFCVNYCLFHAEQSFDIVMYTMTTLGAVCITKGMGDILGF